MEIKPFLKGLSRTLHAIICPNDTAVIDFRLQLGKWMDDGGTIVIPPSSPPALPHDPERTINPLRY